MVFLFVAAMATLREAGMSLVQIKEIFMTKPFTYHTSHLLARKRIGAHWHLKDQASIFLAEHVSPAHFEDPEIHPVLIDALEREGLVQFNRALRAAVPKLRQGKDSSPFWALIDATGFWEDTTPGRWPYMTEERAEVLLAWACSYNAGQSYMGNESKAA